MKNIELKVVCAEHDNIASVLKKICARFEGRLKQIDTYFNCPGGRLKLREINGKRFELIFYQRPDWTRSKVSDYEVWELDRKQTALIKNILKKALGEKVTVQKERGLWIYQHTRIHLDKVKNLGNFLELETVLKNINLERGKKEHLEIIKHLGIAWHRKINNSYSDLLLAKKN